MAQQVRGRFLTRRKARIARQAGQLQLQQDFCQINFREFPGKLLICDIENTIALRGERELPIDVLAAFKRAHDAGYHYVVLRTNKMRKEKFVGIEGDFYVIGDFSLMVQQLEDIFGKGNVILRQPQKAYWPPWAAGKWPRKPWRTTFRGDVGMIQSKLIAEGKTPLSSSQMMAIGDKFRFDVLRPLLMGWNAVLVNPIGEDGKADKYALIRVSERFTLWRLGLKRP